MDKGKDKRLGKRQISVRTVDGEGKQTVMSLAEAVRKVVILKRAKNLKERTIADYETNMRYLMNWMTERYADADASVHEVTTTMRVCAVVCE